MNYQKSKIPYCARKFKKLHDRVLSLSDEGILYGFGSNYYGCVGSPEEEEIMLPRPVEFFLDHPVEQVSCGDSHVVVLTRYGDVYTWGSGEFGQYSSYICRDIIKPVLNLIDL